MTIALGIGANAAVFTVINGTLLRPLPFAASERLAVLWYSIAGTESVTPLSLGDVVQIRATGSATFEVLGASRQVTVDLTGDGDPERVRAEAIDASYLAALGVSPIVGRSFETGDFVPGGERAVVLGYELWRRRFGGDESVLGRTILLSDTAYVVRGVAPPGFTSPFSSAQVWIPLLADAAEETRRGPGDLATIARLRSGVTIEDARRALVLMNRSADGAPPAPGKMGFAAVPIREFMVGKVRSALLVLWGAVTLVMLIAGANLANLILVRETRRIRELAIRAALGATPRRLAQDLFAEALVLAIVGGTLGMLFAVFGARAILSFAPASLGPVLGHAVVDGRVIAFGLLISVATATAAMLFPIRKLRKMDLTDAIKSGGSAQSTSSASPLRSTLVIVEVALALMLLAGAGLLQKSLLRLRSVDIGFEPGGRVTAEIVLWPRYTQPTEWRTFYRRLLTDLRQAPGVVTAAAVGHLPLGASSEMRPLAVEGKSVSNPLEMLVGYQIASGGYFRAMGIPVMRGRDFEDTDDENADGVVIVNQALAQREWPGQNPIGQKVKTSLAPSTPWSTVVGVVGGVRSVNLRVPARPEVFVPFQQRPGSRMDIVVRSNSGLAALVPIIHSRVWAIDSKQPIGAVQNLEDVFSASISEPRFLALSITTFGVFALLLALVGLYGVVSYGLSQRTREFALRLALGAKGAAITRMVLRQCMVPVLIGAGAGVIGSLASVRILGTLLYDVGTTDPVTFLTVAGLLCGTALVTCYLVARRATRQDPSQALRNEATPATTGARAGHASLQPRLG